MESRGGIRLGLRVRADVLLLPIAGLHRRAISIERGAVLPAHHEARDLLRRVAPHRLEQLRLLVADRVRLERARHLHAQIREHLEHVVLHHVAEDARGVVVAAAALDVDGLRHVELDVVDVVLVPQRLEHAVREPKREEVLDGLLAEVVIDSIDLVLLPVCEHVLVELQRRREIGAERLLDDDALPARTGLEIRLVEVVAEQAEEARGDREVEEDVAAGAVEKIELLHLRLQRLEERHVGEAAGHVIEAVDEVLPDLRVELLARVELLDVLAHARAERRGVERVHRRAEQREVLGEEPVAREVVECRDEKTLREITGGAEHQHHARLTRRGAIGRRRAGAADDERRKRSVGHARPTSRSTPCGRSPACRCARTCAIRSSRAAPA